MKNKLYFFALLGAILAFALIITGCENPANSTPGTNPDIWGKITSFNDIIGTWEGTKTIKTPGIPANSLGSDLPAFFPANFPASSIDYTVTMKVAETSFTEKIDLDMDQLLTDWGNLLPKVLVWGYFKGMFEESLKDELESVNGAEVVPNIEFRDADYHVIITYTVPVLDIELTGESAEYVPYINQNKTKLKIVFPEGISMWLGDELILDKKN